MLGTKHTNLTVITLTEYDHMVNVAEFHAIYLLSTKWVDYVEEPMKCQALRPQFFSVGGWGWGVVMEW